MRIQAQAETFAYRVAVSDDSLRDYREERERQERELEENVGDYSADQADHFARGGQPLINFRDWMKGNSLSDAQHAERDAKPSGENYIPDPDAWGGSGPSW